MPTVISQPVPHLDCECGQRRTFPIERVGMPPVGTESFCAACSRTWRLHSISRDTLTGITSWIWSEQNGPAKSTVAAEAHDGLVSSLLGIDGELALALAMLNTGRAENNDPWQGFSPYPDTPEALLAFLAERGLT